MTACPVPNSAIGAVNGILYSVGCNVDAFSRAGYEALTGSVSFLPEAVTALLVIYVGILGFRLMFGVGNTRLNDVGLIGLKIGFVLTLIFNWSVFQTLVFHLAFDGPAEVTEVISRSMDDGKAALASDPVNGLQVVYDELGRDAAALGQVPDRSAQGDDPSPAVGKLERAQTVFLYGTAGAVSVVLVALGILTTIGPIFIAMFILAETVGLFLGWLRAMLTFSILLMLAWVANVMLLTTLEPWLVALRKGSNLAAQVQEQVSIVSTIIDIFAGAQMALVAGAVIVAGGLKLRRSGKTSASLERRRTQSAAPEARMSRAEQIARTIQAGSPASRRDPGFADALAQRTVRTATSSTRPGTSASRGTWVPSGGANRRPSAIDRSRKGRGRK